VSAAAPPAPARGARWTMGTRLSVEVRADDAAAGAAARDVFFAEVQRLESLLTVYRDDSDVSRVNRAAGIAACGVSADSLDAIARALEFARLTEGLYEPTLGPLTAPWKSPAGAPDARAARRALALVGWSRVRVDRARREIFLPERGMALDLGGFAKGYALDRALALSRAIPGLSRVEADFGGQLLFWTPEGRFAPVSVGLEDPRRPGRLARLIEIAENGSVSVSSQSERPGHLVDPRTGRPADAAAGAAVFAPSAAEAEAWSTALFVAGERGAAARLSARPGVRAFFV
jgi:thiamine biosynthesis lipoprotein